MSVLDYRERIYSGVLGKLIGVYLGRPVEGWSYEKIRETFDQVKYFVHDKVGVPLIVADDDISGTFGFFRAIEDYGYNRNMTAEDFGKAWLNYIIENRTILWWGGLGRSTEHTAYLNLKHGIPAPESGSIARNGQTIAEQIGAQIFIDAIAMSCPDDPELAADLTQKAASVSHDGIALQAARHLAALEAMAFTEKNLDRLFDEAERFMHDDELIRIVHDVRNACSREKDWRKVRDYLDPRYGYGVYPGCCHMVPNHSMVIASILLGEDDFQRSVSIAASAAWDTDCNAGNVGAFNGIRLGLDGINAGVDFRTPVADLMYVVTSDGGSVVTDAVRESDHILKAAAMLRGEQAEEAEKTENPRYSFSYPGSLQGFALDDFGKDENAVLYVKNANEEGQGDGLLVGIRHLADGVTARVCTPIFIDFSKLSRNFSTVASPTLYSSQTVHTKIFVPGKEEISVQPYVLYYDINNQMQIQKGEKVHLKCGDQELSFKVPDLSGMLIAKLGYEFFSARRFNGDVIIRSIDWHGAPEYFAQKGMLMNSIWNTDPLWMAGFASSADHFQADFNVTYCVSHTEDDGLATIGTRDWEDYQVTSTLYFSLHQSGGLVLRSRGHRRYYAAVFSGGKTVRILARKDDFVNVLGQVPFSYSEDSPLQVTFEAKRSHLKLSVDGKTIISAEDDMYKGGAAGFIISRGSMTCDSLIIRSC